jgi:hypothetical protein
MIPVEVREVEAALVIFEDRLSALTTGHHLIERSGMLKAEHPPPPCCREISFRPSNNSEVKD